MAANAAQRTIAAVRRSLRVLDRSLGRLSSTQRRQPAAGEASKGPRKPMSAKQKAALKLQGQYMGYIRQLKPAQKAQVKAIREKRGVEAAIKKAMQLAGR